MELAEKFNIEPTKVEELKSGLATVKLEREVLIEAYNGVIDLEITPKNVAVFKELRLKIVKNRTQGIENWHKKTKEIFLRSGQLVDAIKNAEVSINKDMEDKLESAEKYFENLEKERIATLHNERVELLKPYVEDLFGTQFGEMDAQIFDDYLAGAKLRFEAKKEAEEKAEQERLAEVEKQKKISENRNALLPLSNWIENFSNIDFEIVNVNELIEVAQGLKSTQEAEAEAQRVENERLRKEAEAQQKAINAEREKQAKLEAELQSKKDAELKAENARIEAERLAKLEAEILAKAPIKKQLSVWVDGFNIVGSPIINETSTEIEQKFNDFKKWAQSQIKSL